ncbi:MAG TPA: aconitate hydratase [Myxococcales bacterium]|nr:aconitate hydratase [Myxococcales bacterium]
MDFKQRFSHGSLFSLPEVERQGFGKVSRLPVSLRIVLESLLRNLDGKRVREQDVRALASWQAKAERTEEIPFVVARVLLQDFTGVPLVVDLAAMRSAVGKMSKPPKLIEPLVPVDLVIDHSVQVDFARVPNALQLNMGIEFTRNRARYEFLKWGMGAFDGLKIIPPGIGIVHQVNLEYLAPGVHERDGVYYPDSLVGTDSHTTMINGLGIVAWGVGGIEAEAAMLGQPTYFLTPDVIGVHLKGSVRSGVTGTDVVLTITEMLRKAKVVGKFVEFFGEGAASLPVPERATIANMAPEYGATMGYFPIDELSCQYLLATGRPKDGVDALRAYFQAQQMFGIPKAGQCDYTQALELDLSSVKPSVAGPKRPQDRIELPRLKDVFGKILQEPAPNGYGKSKDEIGKRYHQIVEPPPVPHVAGGGEQSQETTPEIAHDGVTKKDTNPLTEAEMMTNRPTPDRVPPQEVHQMKMPVDIGHGDVLIAAITSCTNTSNPSVMLAAGLLAKKAVEKGLHVRPEVKTSLAPGSRVVSRYLEKTGLQPYLDKLGFTTVGYGCTTCIGNSGPLEPHVEQLITKHDLIAASVLSGNRNFEARVHQNIKANFLMSPPLVVAFAIAGRVDIDVEKDPIGLGRDGKPVYLRDLWPTAEELNQALGAAADTQLYRQNYGGDLSRETPEWVKITAPAGLVYQWDPRNTYIREPPYFQDFQPKPDKRTSVRAARALAIFGDSVTTDHISPAGAIKPTSPAGQYLIAQGVPPQDFNSYGARRGNHEVMVRGTFANVRIKNLMAPGTEGGVTVLDGKVVPIYDAAMEYQNRGTPLVILAGHEYGTGSSRDWAAKGTRLLGVRAVIAKSFERIHRSNLVMMGVLPCQFKEGTDASTLKLDGTETFDLSGLEEGPTPRQDAKLTIHRANGKTEDVTVTLRIDTPIEVEYYRHGGILLYVLRQLLYRPDEREQKSPSP